MTNDLKERIAKAKEWREGDMIVYSNSHGNEVKIHDPIKELEEPLLVSENEIVENIFKNFRPWKVDDEIRQKYTYQPSIILDVMIKDTFIKKNVTFIKTQTDTSLFNGGWVDFNDFHNVTIENEIDKNFPWLKGDVLHHIQDKNHSLVIEDVRKCPYTSRDFYTFKLDESVDSLNMNTAIIDKSDWLNLSQALRMQGKNTRPNR